MMDDVEYYISCSNILFINSHINIYFMATHNTFTILHAHKCMSSLSPTKIFFPRSNNKCRLTATKKYYINKNFLEYKKKRKKNCHTFFSSKFLLAQCLSTALCDAEIVHSTQHNIHREKSIIYWIFKWFSHTISTFFYIFATATK